MTAVEQMRERQEEIVQQFSAQSSPAGYSSDATKRAIVTAGQNAKPRARGKKTLPPPSQEAVDFILRATANPVFQALMARLASE